MSSLLGRVVDEVDTLLDVVLETGDSLLQETLLLAGDALERVVGLLGSVGTKLNGDREEVDANLLGNGLAAGNAGEVDVAGLDETLLTLGSPQDLLGEAEASVGHGQGSGAAAILGLNDLVTTELDTVDESVVLVVGDAGGRSNLAEEGNNGLARVTADNGDSEILGLCLAGDLCDKGLGTDNVEGGDTEQLLGVENLLGLEHLGGDGDCRVDRVGDDKDEGVGGDLSSGLDQALDNAGVDLEEVVSGHAGLAGNAGRDDDDVGILEGGLCAVVGGEVAADFGLGGDVGKVGSNSRGVDNIVQSQLVDVGAGLEEERERLANATRGTSDDGLDHCKGY
jgi:hypothetical protein